MIIPKTGGQVVCDGVKAGKECGQILNIMLPPVKDFFSYWVNVLQQALDCGWTCNYDNGKIFCPRCSRPTDDGAGK
ncbi:MAG: hypothetical protein WC473_00080 [Patescibacteria group bacterium]